MKKISYLLAIILVLGLLPMMQTIAKADGEVLYLDNTNVYSGMDMSYSAGYRPTVNNNKVSIVLPLINISTDAILNNQITATVDLGSTNNTPFVYANYQRNVALVNNSVQDGGIVNSYLVRFDIPLSSNRYMGTYAVNIDILYSTTSHENVVQPFTIYFTTDGKDPNATPEPKKDPLPREQPKVIIERYTLSKDVIQAGEEFNIDIILKNTEDHWYAKNIVVSYTGETTDIIPNANSNTFHIPEIKDRRTRLLKLELKALANAEPEPHKVIITIAYEDSAGTSYNVNEEIVVIVQQPIRLKLDTVNLPDTVNAGDSIPISMQLFNMGKSTLFNVMVTLEMTGVIPDGSSYIGHMESGTAGKSEIYAFFGTLDMGENATDTENKYGISTGTLTVYYEDEFGTPYTETINISTTIERPVFDDVYKQNSEPEKEEPRMISWWATIGILIGIALIIIGITSYRRGIDRVRREYGDSSGQGSYRR